MVSAFSREFSNTGSDIGAGMDSGTDPEFDMVECGEEIGLNMGSDGRLSRILIFHH